MNDTSFGLKLKRMIGVQEQVALCNKRFPGIGDLDPAYSVEESIPSGYTWCVVPRWSFIADGSSYFYATRVMLEVYGDFCHEKGFVFHNDCGLPKPLLIEWEKVSAERFEALYASRGGNLLLIPVQYGCLHLGKNPRDVTLGVSEVRADLFHLLCAMSVQSPGVIFMDEQWRVSCAGSKFSHGEDGCFNDVPVFDRYMFDSGKEEWSICLTPANNLIGGESTGIASFFFRS